MNYLSEEQASLLVGEVEKREKLYDVCINDIPIWQLVRLNGIRSLQNLPLSKANKKLNNSIKNAENQLFLISYVCTL